MRMLILFLLLPVFLVAQNRNTIPGITDFSGNQYIIPPRGADISAVGLVDGSIRYSTTNNALVHVSNSGWVNIPSIVSGFTSNNRLVFGSGAYQLGSATELYYGVSGSLGIKINPQYSLDVSGTDAIRIPFGNSSQRPTPSIGTIRYNTDVAQLEHGYEGSVFSRIPSYSNKELADEGDYLIFQDDVWLAKKPEECIILACSNETSTLATTTAAVSIRMPYGATITRVQASTNTAPVGSPVIIDVRVSGSSIFSTRPQVDAGATTSVGSTVTPVISNSTVAYNSPVSVDIFSASSGTGLKVYIYYTKQ